MHSDTFNQSQQYLHLLLHTVNVYVLLKLQYKADIYTNNYNLLMDPAEMHAPITHREINAPFSADFLKTLVRMLAC